MSELPYPYHNLEVLEENSKHWTVLCPFHRETEPSMTINKGGKFPLWFRCWGCGCQGSPKQYAEHFKMNPNDIKYIPIKKEVPVEVNWEKRLHWEGSGVLSREFAKYLGILPQTLAKFRLGYYQGKFLVPMFGEHGKIVGIQEHYWDIKTGKHVKKGQKHSKHGVFKPNIEFDITKPIIVNEGFSDTACSVEMGFQAIGKYNALYKCTAATISALKKFKRVLIIADNDEDDVGARGAGELYEELPNSDILLPPDPYNDEREWMLAVGVEKLSERINWLLK
jgi:hypothetical protein